MRAFFFLIIIFFLVIIYYFFYYSSIKEDKIIYIEKGKSLKEISYVLEKNNVIFSHYPFYFYFRLIGKDKSLDAGEYLFKKNITFYKVLNNFNANNLIYRKITIPECYTINDIRNLFRNNQYITGDILSNPMEGSIFPDTYFFLRDVNVNILIKRMQTRMEKKLDEVWKGNYKFFKSKNDLLIMASMIEAEAKKKKKSIWFLVFFIIG